MKFKSSWEKDEGGFGSEDGESPSLGFETVERTDWIHNTAALRMEGKKAEKFHAMQAENVLNKISIMLRYIWQI